MNTEDNEKAVSALVALSGEIDDILEKTDWHMATPEPRMNTALIEIFGKLTRAKRKTDELVGRIAGKA